MAVQANGKVLVGSYYTIGNGQPGIARLNPDGSMESFPKFNADVGPNGVVGGLALQADGKILVSGYYFTLNSHQRHYLARLLNEPATQSLTIVEGWTVQWTRGGSAPEVEQVIFEQSTNGGGSWSLLGAGTRISSGWQLTGLGLSANAAIRARGRTTGGGNNHNSGLVEQTLNVPDIAVLDSFGADLFQGRASASFGTVVTGSSSGKLFTIRNTGTGTATLNELTVSLAPAGNPGDFTISPLGATTLAPGAETTFTVSFSPTAAGTRTAMLQIASNDPDENPFEINLTGTQATPSEAWRQTYFGSPYNSGTGADLSDPDGDGIVNLLEYATATDPLVSTPFPGKLVKNGSLLEFTYTRRKAAVGEMTFVREFSETLTGTWSTVAGTVETILSDDGVLQEVKTTVPAGSAGKRFVRLRVTRS